MNLSVVISAHNEEKKIEECIRSVQFADEIIVIDSSSTDRTAEIAKKYTKHVIKKDNNIMLNVNKNYGFTKATSEWILNLDADERVTPELGEEIKKICERNDQTFTGFEIKRRNIVFGKWMQHSGWYPDYQLRLFRTGKGKFPEVHVHEKIEVEGTVGKLQEHIIHYNYETITQFVLKHSMLYAPNEADALLAQGYNVKHLDVLRMPFNEFLSRYFARKGYKDGFHGLVLSLLLAFYHLLIFVHIWEKKNFPEFKEEALWEDTKKEAIKMQKELRHWYYNEKIENSKDFIEQLVLRMKRKL